MDRNNFRYNTLKKNEVNVLCLISSYKFRVVTEQPLGYGTTFDVLNTLLYDVAIVSYTTGDNL